MLDDAQIFHNGKQIPLKEAVDAGMKFTQEWPDRGIVISQRIGNRVMQMTANCPDRETFDLFMKQAGDQLYEHEAPQAS